MKIMLVEDNPKTRAAIKSILKRSLNNVTDFIESDDGKESVRLYQQFKPDWVLMDINLKTLDGLQASRHIIAADAKAKVIIVTMYDDPEYREVAEEIGAVQYVLKENLFKLPQIITNKKINRKTN